MSEAVTQVHSDPELDNKLAWVVVRGGEVDHQSSPTFIWVHCRCGGPEHMLTVRRESQEPEYARRKIRQIVDVMACLTRT